MVTACATSDRLPGDDAIRSIRSEPATGQADAVLVSSLPLLHTCQILPLDGHGMLLSEDPAAQVQAAFANLQRLVDSGGAQERYVVKLNVYVRDEEIQKLVRQECAKAFRGSVQPAVSVIATSLPVAGARIALDAVVSDPKATNGEVQGLGRAADFGGRGGTVAARTLPAGPRVYIAGQAEKGDGSLEDSTRQTMASLMKTMKFLQLEPRHVIQLKAFLTPMAEADTVYQTIAAMPEFAGKAIPPVILVEWKSTLPIEIELIAAAPTVKPSTSEDSVEYLTPPGMTASPVYARVTRVRHPTSVYIGGLVSEKVTTDGAAEVRDIFRRLETVLQASASDFRHLVKATYYVANDEVSNQLNQLRPEYYQPQRPPAASKAAVSSLGIPDRHLTIDMIAVPGRGD